MIKEFKEDTLYVVDESSGELEIGIPFCDIDRFEINDYNDSPIERPGLPPLAATKYTGQLFFKSGKKRVVSFSATIPIDTLLGIVYLPFSIKDARK